MNKPLSPLLRPLQIRSVSLRNRIVMPPMTRGFCPDGVPGDDVAGYYERRARHQVGLVVTEAVGIDHPAALGSAGLGEANMPCMHGEQALAGWQRVVEQVHAAGGVIFPQLWHQGPMREPGTGPVPDAVSCRPSGDWGPTGRLTSLSADFIERMAKPAQMMTERDIEDVIAAYGRSAHYAKAAGFDGIAILGAHGYLIDSFLWHETNRRTDRWGGDRVQRTRFAVEVVKGIRAAIGPHLPIMFRFSQWKQQDFNARLAQNASELEAMLGPLADAGVDVFDASTPYFAKPAFADSPLSLAGWARKVTGKLSMAVGGIGIPKKQPHDASSAFDDNLDLLIDYMARDEFDLIGVGRSLLADPAWLHKTVNRQPSVRFQRDALDSLI